MTAKLNFKTLSEPQRLKDTLVRENQEISIKPLPFDSSQCECAAWHMRISFDMFTKSVLHENTSQWAVSGRRHVMFDIAIVGLPNYKTLSEPQRLKDTLMKEVQ